jgi:hypothetical protein
MEEDMAKIKGTSRSDVLRGSLGDDVIRGGKGADIIDGNSGNDRLFGGPGRDIFIVENGSDLDTIHDFQSGKDRIVFVFDERVGIIYHDDTLLVAFTNGAQVPAIHFDPPTLFTSNDFLIL